MTLVRSSVLLFAAAIGVAQPVGSLKRVTLPERSSLNQYVQDQTALIVLGKALFWDMQSGSDGRLACATCHFHAGADHRAQNQLSNPLGTFTANYRLTLDDFPFHQLADVNNNNSTVLRDSSQRAGSSGTFRRL